MINELSNSIIYNDFINKVKLTEDETKILNMMLSKYTLVKMSQQVHMSDRNVSRIKKDIKEKYTMYRKIEMARLEAFKS